MTGCGESAPCRLGRQPQDPPSPHHVTLPGSWACTVVPGPFGAGVCALVVVLLVASVVLSGLAVTLLVALGVAGLPVVASWMMRPAAVVWGCWLGTSRVLEVWGRGVEPGPEDMAFRIQSLRRVIRA